MRTLFRSNARQLQAISAARAQPEAAPGHASERSGGLVRFDSDDADLDTSMTWRSEVGISLL